MGFEPTTLRDLVGRSERPTRSRRVVGSNPIWNSDFFPSLILMQKLHVVLNKRMGFIRLLTAIKLSLMVESLCNLPTSAFCTQCWGRACPQQAQRAEGPRQIQSSKQISCIFPQQQGSSLPPFSRQTGQTPS